MFKDSGHEGGKEMIGKYLESTGFGDSLDGMGKKELRMTSTSGQRCRKKTGIIMAKEVKGLGRVRLSKIK